VLPQLRADVGEVVEIAAAPDCCTSFTRRFGLEQLVKRNWEVKGH
jgi:hypothetical protein